MNLEMPNKAKKENVLNLSPIQSLMLFLVVLFGLFLRFGMIDMVDGTAPIRNDALEYYSYAVNLKQFDTYSMEWPGDLIKSNLAPTADNNRPPGYAFFLYPFVSFPPTIEMVHSIRSVQALFDTITIFLAFLIFRNFLNFPPALSASTLVAVSPHLISMNIYLLSETMFTFFLMLYIFLTIKAFKSKQALFSLLGGITLGVTILLKPTMNYYIPVLFLLFFFYIQKEKSYKLIGTFIIGLVLISSPWAIRNSSDGIPPPPRV